MKFVKAKEPIAIASTVEKENVEKKKNVTDQRVLNKPRNQSVGGDFALASDLTTD